MKKIYREKLDKLFVESKGIDYNKISALNDLADGENGYYKDIHNDLEEYTDWTTRFMRRWGIGKYISKSKWGPKRYQQINSKLQQIFFGKKKPDEEPVDAITPPKNHHDLRDDLKKKASGEEYSDYDFSRVARTETARMKAIYQLLEFKKMGLKYVKYKTRNDNRVGEDHKKLNNREFEIDWLLSPAGESVRITNRPNCRCRYMASMKGLK